MIFRWGTAYRLSQSLWCRSIFLWMQRLGMCWSKEHNQFGAWKSFEFLSGLKKTAPENHVAVWGAWINHLWSSSEGIWYLSPKWSTSSTDLKLVLDPAYYTRSEASIYTWGQAPGKNLGHSERQRELCYRRELIGQSSGLRERKAWICNEEGTRLICNCALSINEEGTSSGWELRTTDV